jgi:hypothetical protein
MWLNLNYPSAWVALKGHGFSRAVTSAESWDSAPEGSRISSQHRGPSVAKAIMNDADVGTAEEAAEKVGKADPSRAEARS